MNGLLFVEPYLASPSRGDQSPPPLQGDLPAQPGGVLLELRETVRTQGPALRNTLWIVCLLVALAHTPLAVNASTAAAPVEILLSAETDTELAPLREKLKTTETFSEGAWTFWLGELHERRVVLARTDPGPLNAVASTTIAIRRFQPGLVVSFGTARPHDPALKPLDVVVGERAVPFDGFFSPRRELGGGSTPGAWKKIPHAMMTVGEKETDTDSFAAAPFALEIARALTNPRGRVVVGVLGSAYQINRETDRITAIRADYGTSCEDFESGHVAGCASLLGVPMIGLRVIAATDTAETKESERLAGEMALRFVQRLTEVRK